MSVTFTNDGKGKIVAHGVDFNRLVRELAKAFNLTKDAAADKAAQFLGARNLHELVQRSQAPDVRAWDWSKIEDHISKAAISNGAHFPRTLPASHGPSWQKQGMALLKEAGKLITPGALEFIALVGAPQSGKTVLGANFAKAKDGLVVDVTLRSIFDRFEPTTPVVFLDRPVAASIPPSTRREIPLLAWNDLPSKERSLENAKEFLRRPVSGMPWDEVPAYMGTSQETPARTMARAVFLVVAFPSVQAVQDAIDSGLLIKLSGYRNSAATNWRAAHVVDLDHMKLMTLLGAGGRMENGSYEPPRS